MTKTNTILTGCLEFGLPFPVSAADLHEVYSVFRLERFEHNSMDTPCWRGICDCLDLYGTGADHARARQIIMDDIELCGRWMEG